MTTLHEEQIGSSTALDSQIDEEEEEDPDLGDDEDSEQCTQREVDPQANVDTNSMSDTSQSDSEKRSGENDPLNSHTVNQSPIQECLEEDTHLEKRTNSKVANEGDSGAVSEPELESYQV